MNVEIYDHDMKVGTITLPNGRVSTQYLKANWPAIISGPLLKVMLSNCGYEELGLATEADFVVWLQDHKNWKRGYKGKLREDEEEYWGITVPVKDCIHRMLWTDEFHEALDLNFISYPKDTSLLSIHVHSD